jgi:hypothetical protein
MSDISSISSSTAFQTTVIANAPEQRVKEEPSSTPEAQPQEAQKPATDAVPQKDSPSVYNTVQSASNSTVDSAGVNVVV